MKTFIFSLLFPVYCFCCDKCINQLESQKNVLSKRIIFYMHSYNPHETYNPNEEIDCIYFCKGQIAMIDYCISLLKEYH